MKRILGVVLVAAVVAGAAPVIAGQLGSAIPSNCVAHVTFDGGVDLVDDYRCAGVAIEFHTAGVAFSPGPIWAGQWLFVDEEGQFRVGTCTFNRGIHPTIDVPSAVVAQHFPNDPTGAKTAYLMWRYGDTRDDLTAAAMWAVMHYYAQDAAGTRRAWTASAPLVPALGMIGRASGRADIQALAEVLDAEATASAGERALAMSLGIDGSVAVTVTADRRPVGNAPVTLLVSGRDEEIVVQTDATGVARTVVPVAPGVVSLVATAVAPGPALVYRGTPAGPDPQGAQNLVTAGPPRTVSATATIEVPAPATTTTTTEAPTTTTTEAPTTTTTVVVDAVEALPPATTPETVPAPLPVPSAPLPKTGKGSDVISYVATAFLVAGVGIVGVAGRRGRRRVIYTR